MRGFGQTICLLLAVFAFASTREARAEDLVGNARHIVSAERFALCEGGKCTRIRLCGIAAPAEGMPGYAASLFAITKLIDRQRVRCRPVGQGSVCDGHTDPSSSNRVLAQCFLVGTDTDIASVLVARAHACDWVRRSGGHYSKDNPGAQCSPP